MFPFLAVIALALGETQADPSLRAATGVVRALERDDYDALAPIARNIRQRESWTPVSEVIERYDCIEIEHFAVGAPRGDIHPLTIRGHAVATGATRRPVTLPKNWLMKIDAQGLVESVQLAETAVAREMKFATDAERDRILAAHTDLDPALIGRELAIAGAYGWDTGRHAPAVEYVVKLARRLGDRHLESEGLRLLSTAQFNIPGGKPLVAAEESLRVSLEAGSSDDIAASIFKIGIAQWSNGDLQTAVETLSTGGRLIDTVDDPRICLKSLHMASYVSQIGHDYRGALVAAERLEEEARRYGWREGESGAAGLLGEVHTALRNYEAAIGHYQRMVRIAEEIRNPYHRVTALTSIARCELKRGNVAAAKAATDKAGGDILEPLARFQFDLGVADIQMREGRLAEADDTLQCLIAMIGPDEWAKTTGAAVIARSEIARRRGDPWRALDLAVQAWNVTITDDTTGMYWSPWPAYAAAGAALRALGEREFAIAAYQSAIALIEEVRDRVPPGSMGRTLYLEDKAQPYVALVELLVETGRLDEALLVAGRIKARALREMLEDEGNDSSAQMTVEQRAEERALEQEILRWNLAAAAARVRGPVPDEIQIELAKARARRDEFTERLHISHPEHRQQRRPEAAESLQPPPRGVTVVEYVVGDVRTTVFVLRRSRAGGTAVEARTLPVTREQLRTAVEALVRSVERRDLGYTARARSLYDTLLAPIEPALAGANTLCVIPDDVLSNVPFHALRTPSGKWTIEHFAVHYAPSLATLRRSEPHRQRPPRVIAFGNPSLQPATIDRVRAIYRDAALGALPEAEEEARTIARIYGSRGMAFTGADARESRFKEHAAGATVIHIATHGFLDHHAPMYSALSLAASHADGQDGLLEAREVLTMALDADLAVLSACETARGHVGIGEGVIGLPWAFLAAGCRATAVTQWKAESVSAAKLMIEFHRRYRDDPNPAAALRAAQLALARSPRYRHPFYWAPFIILGANDAVP